MFNLYWSITFFNVMNYQIQMVRILNFLVISSNKNLYLMEKIISNEIEI